MIKPLLLVIVVFALVLSPGVANADSHSWSDTDVQGTVRTYGRHKDRQIRVTVSCDGHTKVVKTDGRHNYHVKFSKSECRKDSWINVSSDYHGERGHSRHKSDGHGHCQGDVDSSPPVTDVPEFGTIAAIAAAVLGGAAFLVIRRRQLSEHRS